MLQSNHLVMHACRHFMIVGVHLCKISGETGIVLVIKPQDSNFKITLKSKYPYHVEFLLCVPVDRSSVHSRIQTF